MDEEMFNSENMMMDELNAFNINGIESPRERESDLSVIEEADEFLEDLEDSFEIDEKLLPRKVKMRLYDSAKKLKYGLGTIIHSDSEEESEDHSIKSLEANSDFHDSDVEFNADLLKDSTHINLSKINTIERYRTFKERKSCFIISHDSKWKKYWDSFLAFLIVI